MTGGACLVEGFAADRSPTAVEVVSVARASTATTSRGPAVKVL
jgi:hypothetical protein